MTDFTTRNSFIRTCHPETSEIITNAEHAFQRGEITRAERDAVIMSCIASETEHAMLGAKG